MNRALSLFVAFLLAFLVGSQDAESASANFVDVCASGCAYNSVQSAIDSIPAPNDAAHVWTVFLDSGVLTSDSSITTGGKSYINFVGRGMGVSVLKASAAWYQNVVNGTQSSDFVDLAGSTNITIRGLTIDARTLDPGGLTNSVNFGGLQVGDSDRVLIDSAEIQGIVYALWEDSNTASHLIEVFNSKIRGANAAISARTAVWHIFSTDIRAVTTGAESGGIVTCTGLQIFGTSDTTVWGSHIHAESSHAGMSYLVTAVESAMSTGGSLTLVGSTLHVKMTTSNIGSSARFMTSFHSAMPYLGEASLTGCDLLYQSTVSLSQGRIGGIGYSSTNPAAQINVVGTSFTDKASGGSFRGDIVGAPFSFAPQNQPTIRNAGSRISTVVTASGTPLLAGTGGNFDTTGIQKGSATFPGNSTTVAVTLPAAMPDLNYRIGLSASAPESIYVTGKSLTGFTLNSPNGTSTATVEWVVVR